jgi:hypothetical protein
MGKHVMASSLVTAALLTLAGPASAAWYDCRVIDNQATDAWDNTLVDLPMEADSLAEAERKTRAFVAQDPGNPTDISLNCRVNEEE